MTNPYEAPGAPPTAPPPADVAGRDAIWALVLGAASLVFCAPITAPFALWKASRAMRVGPSGTANVAIVLAVFGLLSSAFFWFLAAWQFLVPGSPH
jgi:hypothetical protein